MHRTLASLCLTACATGALAAERHYSGARTVAMGGASVAIADGSQVQTANPATLAWSGIEAPTGPGIDISLSIGAELDGDIQPLLTAVQKAYQDLNNLGAAIGLNAVQTDNYVELIKQLQRLEKEDLLVDAYADVGAQWHHGRWAVGARSWWDSTGYISETDFTNIGLTIAGALANGLNDNAAELIGIDPDTYVIQRFTTEQVQTLSDTGYTDNAIKALDALIEDVPPEWQADLVDVLAQVPLSNLDSLPDNQTLLTLGTLVINEIPVSYGHRLTEHVAIGATAKFMIGIIGGRQFRVIDPESKELLYEHIGTTDSDLNVGLDLALHYRQDAVRVGLLARNLNEPSFTGHIYSDGDVTYRLERNLTLGLGLDPTTWLTVACDVDLLPYKRLNRSVEEQPLSIGLECRPLSRLALRGGISTNIATSDQTDDDTAISLGIAYTGRHLRTGLGLASGTDIVTYEDWRIPKQLRCSFTFAWQF